jgi:Tfp pilus assembly protein PilO
MSRLATIIICFLLSSVIAFFLLLPEINKYSDFGLKIKAEDLKLKDQENYFSQILDLNDKLKVYQPELDKIDSAIPSEPSVPSLLDFIQGISAQSGLVFNKLSSFSITTPKKPTKGEENVTIPVGLKQISITFEASGDYSALKNFLSKIEESSRLVEVDSIVSVKAGAAAAAVKQEGSLSLNITIKAYSY